MAGATQQIAQHTGNPSGSHLGCPGGAIDITPATSPQSLESVVGSEGSYEGCLLGRLDGALAVDVAYPVDG